MLDTEYIDREFMDNLYLISKGIRSCYFGAMFLKPNEKYKYYDIAVFDSFSDIIKIFEDTTKEFDLYLYVKYIEKNEDKFCDYWIYKYKHQKNILDMIYKEKNNYLKQWMMGKLLGYSDESMEEFLNKI